MGEDPYAELFAQYRAALPQRLRRIERLRAGLERGTLPAEKRAQLRREVHALVGSGETFGLREVSAAARAAEALLERPGRPRWTELRAAIAAIAHAAGTDLASKTSRRRGV